MFVCTKYDVMHCSTLVLLTIVIVNMAGGLSLMSFPILTFDFKVSVTLQQAHKSSLSVHIKFFDLSMSSLQMVVAVFLLMQLHVC